MKNYDSYRQSMLNNIAVEAISLEEEIGLDKLHTPALILDLDVFESNLTVMRDHLSQHNIGLRAHAKMHKCPMVAQRQIDMGAIGVCTATVSEAEVMLKSGIENILITSPVASRDKYERVLGAAAEAKGGLQLVVDNIEGAGILNTMAAERDQMIGVLIDLDPGMGRTGIETGEPALALAQFIVDACSHLEFRGLQMYAGNCMHIHGYDKRREKYLGIMERGAQTKLLLEANGIVVPVFTGGGTGTYDIEPELGLLTDIQAGSYAFMDVEYRDIGGQQGSDHFLDFQPSLFVLVTAISQPQKRLITVDAGYKAFASDTVKPEFRDVEGVRFHWGGDEHGIVQLDNPSTMINLGDKLPMITSHCDPTVNLYECYFPYRDGLVSEIWPVSARGRSQ